MNIEHLFEEKEYPLLLNQIDRFEFSERIPIAQMLE